MAQERDRPDVRAARHLWITRRQARMRAEPHRLVFLDETSIKTNLTRLRARTYDDLIAAIGDVCAFFDPTDCWNSFSAARYASD